MRDLDQQRPSRLAIVFVAVGLVLAAIGIAYIIYADPGRERELPPLPPNPPIKQLDALYRALTFTFILFLAFLLGSYLMVRLRRRMFARSRDSVEQTQYVDAWSNYRLTEDQIDAAMKRIGDELPPDVDPHWDDDAENPPPTPPDED